MQDTQERAGIYCRLSEDREGRELGIQRQEEDCRRLAAHLGVEVLEVYKDSDISASILSKKGRPDYQRLLNDAQAGVIKVVLAYTTSRLTRRPREHEDLIDLAIQHGVRFHFIASPSFDLNTAAGREIARHMAARDTAEAEDIQERTQRKKLSDAIAGKSNGGPRAYGYGQILGVNPATGEEVRDNNSLVPEEVAVLQECRDLVLSGHSQMFIVKMLNKRRVPSAKGYDWTVGKLRRTLLNKKYVIFDDDDELERGTRVHKGAEYQAVWTGIFSQSDHNAMANIFASNITPWAKEVLKPRRYLLSGLAFCGSCGGHMYGQGKTDNGRYIRRYVCKKWDNRGEQVGCGKIFRIADPVEQLVSEAVLYRFDSPEIEEALAPAKDKARVRELTLELAKLTHRRKLLAEEHAINPYEDYTVMLGTIKQKADRIERELSKLRTDKVRTALLPPRGHLRKAWDDSGLEWRVAVAKLIVEKVVIHPGRPGAKMFNGYRFDPDLIEVTWSA